MALAAAEAADLFFVVLLGHHSSFHVCGGLQAKWQGRRLLKDNTKGATHDTTGLQSLHATQR